MKITDLKVWLTRPAGRTWTFIQIETDEGLTGLGEATNAGGGGSLLVGRTVRMLRASTITTDFRETLIGEDPNDIDRIWHKLYRRFTAMGSRGLPTTVISGIDIALWDLKGKALGRPIYDLLGGKFRDRILLYTHVDHRNSPEAAAQHARSLVAEGYTALKTDPFSGEMGPQHRQYTTGTISSEGEEKAESIIAAIREAVGPRVEVLIDAHGNFNVPTAVRLIKRMSKYNLTWFEEPVQPEGFDALAQVRQQVDVPISVGERLYTRYDFLPIFKNRLADYVMPDVVWTGGISELRKIANMAEAYYIPISPHDASGPINILAGAHTMMTVPNFYRLEFGRSTLEAYNACIDPPLDVRGGYLYLSNRPGLGIELNLDYIQAYPDSDWE